MSLESFPISQNTETEKPKISLFLEQIEKDKQAVSTLIEEYKKSDRDPEVGSKLRAAWEKLSDDNTILIKMKNKDDQKGIDAGREDLDLAA